MFEGRLIEDEPRIVRIQCDELEAPIYVDHGVSSAPAPRVWAAIRPEKVTSSAGRSRPPRTTGAMGVVRDIAYMGDLSVYLLRLDRARSCASPSRTFRHAEDRSPGTSVFYLSWHASSPVVVTK